MNAVLFFLVPLVALLQWSNLQARTVTVPKRETAQAYYLKLTNRLTQESITLDSMNGKFELPENLEGEFNLEVSFTDKWGREIQGQGPKLIQLISKTKKAEAQKEEPFYPVVGIVFTPYSASGTYQADISDSLIAAKKTSGTFNSIGINTILKIYALEKWKLGLDMMQGQDKATQLNTTEITILYDWQVEKQKSEQFLFSSGASVVSSELKDVIQENSDTINTSATAQSAYIFGNGVFNYRFAKSTFATAALVGFSTTYFRYHIGQSFLYSISNRLNLGPWLDYSKFENGNKNGAIRANILKLGISFNVNL